MCFRLYTIAIFSNIMNLIFLQHIIHNFYKKHQLTEWKFRNSQFFNKFNGTHPLLSLILGEKTWGAHPDITGKPLKRTHTPMHFQKKSWKCYWDLWPLTDQHTHWSDYIRSLRLKSGIQNINFRSREIFQELFTLLHYSQEKNSHDPAKQNTQNDRLHWLFIYRTITWQSRTKFGEINVNQKFHL